MKLEYKNLKQLDEFLEMYWNDITAGGTFPPESEDLDNIITNCMTFVENLKKALKDSESGTFYVITQEEKEAIELLLDDWETLVMRMNPSPIPTSDTLTVSKMLKRFNEQEEEPMCEYRSECNFYKNGDCEGLEAEHIEECEPDLNFDLTLNSLAKKHRKLGIRKKRKYSQRGKEKERDVY